MKKYIANERAADMRRDVKINDVEIRISQATIRSDILKKSAAVDIPNALSEMYRDWWALSLASVSV